MINSITIELKSFQEDVADQLLDIVTNPFSKPTIIVKSPTGSGKTVILVAFISEYLTSVADDVAFIWLCPGKGDLEEQSRYKMRGYAPHLSTQSLFDALTSGFRARTTTFINWELITKRGNSALRDGERANLYDRIDEAHRNGTKFIIIVDEEHSNNTSRARNIMSAFNAAHTIRVSATARQKKDCEYIEVSEDDVIASGLITKAIYVNEGLDDNALIDEDYNTLLELADAKRQAIAEQYREVGSNVRPLVLIQFPSGQPETIEAVEQKLEDMGYTYDNGMVSKWMSEDKRDLPDNLTDNNGQPVFLLMKQAISTGWDCPRAKILVKLRENMSETFTIQTIGRIRRMPEGKHYDNDLLDFCYVYTLDEKYKEGLLDDVEKAYETRRLFLKNKCKVFTIEKETRDLDYDGFDPQEVLEQVYNTLVAKYSLTDDMDNNKRIFEENGYIFGEDIIGSTLMGEFVHTSALADAQEERFITTRHHVNTHTDGMNLRHAIDAIKTAVGVSYDMVATILRRLFRASRYRSYCLLSLSNKEWWAFVINNYRLLRQEFVDVTAIMNEQTALPLAPHMSEFHIPVEDFFHYDPDVKDEVEFLSNAYENYTSGFVTTRVRGSICEVLFEQYCEGLDTVDWVYKNGDSGQQYFSVVFIDNLHTQKLFYPDYIVKMRDGTVWLIETKGGEGSEGDKNIDPQIGNKFNALKRYAESHGLNWGFVRDKDNQLYINNTEFVEDMSDDRWVSLRNIL